MNLFSVLLPTWQLHIQLSLSDISAIPPLLMSKPFHPLFPCLQAEKFELKCKYICSSQVNLSTTSAGGTMSSPRPHGPATSATKTALNQSVLLGGNSAGPGQMYLRVR